MRAIILAAGRGLRLRQTDDVVPPKCLLRFGGMSLLERHFQLLSAAGVDEFVLALGWRHEHVEAELARIGWRPQIVLNPRFELGSLLTVHTVAAAMTRGGDVLLMDADVLYDARIAAALLAGSAPVNRILIDREFEPGDEPVKVCVKDGLVVDFRKMPDPAVAFDTIGESVGFFRFNDAGARHFAGLVDGYVSRGLEHLPHEEAIRDFFLERRHDVDIADVTGLPWIEIDFPDDVERARREILPALAPLRTVERGSENYRERRSRGITSE